MKQIFGGAAPRGHYTPGIISGGMLYISGQTSVDPSTGVVTPGGPGAETLTALRRMEGVLTAAGLTKEHVVNVRIYMTDIEQWDEINRAYAEFFGDHKPARAAIPVRPLSAGCAVEIEAIAEVPEHLQA